MVGRNREGKSTAQTGRKLLEMLRSRASAERF